VGGVSDADGVDASDNSPIGSIATSAPSASETRPAELFCSFRVFQSNWLPSAVA